MKWAYKSKITVLGLKKKKAKRGERVADVLEMKKKKYSNLQVKDNELN